MTSWKNSARNQYLVCTSSTARDAGTVPDATLVVGDVPRPAQRSDYPPRHESSRSRLAIL